MSVLCFLGNRTKTLNTLFFLYQAASHCCGIPGRNSGHIRPVRTGPAPQLPSRGDAFTRRSSLTIKLVAFGPDDVPMLSFVPPGGHRPPAVGGVVFCGVHVLLGREAEVVGRSLGQPGF